MDPEEKIQEARALLAQPYASEEDRRKTVFRYMMWQQGLPMFLYGLCPKEFPLRMRYVRLVKETLALLVLALILAAFWVARFSAFELAEILSAGALRAGFFGMLGSVVVMWALVLIMSFRARAALLQAAYEMLKHIAKMLHSRETDSDATA